MRISVILLEKNAISVTRYCIFNSSFLKNHKKKCGLATKEYKKCKHIENDKLVWSYSQRIRKKWPSLNKFPENL